MAHRESFSLVVAVQGGDAITGPSTDDICELLDLLPKVVKHLEIDTKYAYTVELESQMNHLIRSSVR
jgi:hypothetical protein